MDLAPDRLRALRALAHRRKPVVTVGAAGPSDAVAAELDRALSAHELVKVRLVTDDRDERRRWAGALCAATGAALVQAIGKVVVLYREEQEGN